MKTSNKKNEFENAIKTKQFNDFSDDFWNMVKNDDARITLETCNEI